MRTKLGHPFDCLKHDRTEKNKRTPDTTHKHAQACGRLRFLSNPHTNVNYYQFKLFEATLCSSENVLIFFKLNLSR